MWLTGLFCRSFFCCDSGTGCVVECINHCTEFVKRNCLLIKLHCVVYSLEEFVVESEVDEATTLVFVFEHVFNEVVEHLVGHMSHTILLELLHANLTGSSLDIVFA